MPFNLSPNTNIQNSIASIHRKWWNSVHSAYCLVSLRFRFYYIVPGFCMGRFKYQMFPQLSHTVISFLNSLITTTCRIIILNILWLLQPEVPCFHHLVSYCFRRASLRSTFSPLCSVLWFIREFLEVTFKVIKIMITKLPSRHDI